MVKLVNSKSRSEWLNCLVPGAIVSLFSEGSKAFHDQISAIDGDFIVLLKSHIKVEKVTGIGYIEGTVYWIDEVTLEETELRKKEVLVAKFSKFDWSMLNYQSLREINTVLLKAIDYLPVEPISHERKRKLIATYEDLQKEKTII